MEEDAQQSNLPNAADQGAEMPPMLSAEEKQLLLQLARQSLIDYLSSGDIPTLTTATAALLQPRAVFVTLRRRDSGELRGCRGESRAQRPLCQAVALMAVAAGVDDPRFVPVTPDELPLLHIEINALTPIQPIEPEAVEIGRHGLLLVKGDRAGLLLPEVPLHHNWDRATFLRAICHKARLPHDAWRDPTSQLYAFEAEIWQEEMTER